MANQAKTDYVDTTWAPSWHLDEYGRRVDHTDWTEETTVEEHEYPCPHRLGPAGDEHPFVAGIAVAIALTLAAAIVTAVLCPRRSRK